MIYKYEESRKVVVDFINVKFEEIVFIKNMSESFNFVVFGLEYIFEKGDKIVIILYEYYLDLFFW